MFIPLFSHGNIIWVLTLLIFESLLTRTLICAVMFSYFKSWRRKLVRFVDFCWYLHACFAEDLWILFFFLLPIMNISWILGYLVNFTITIVDSVNHVICPKTIQIATILAHAISLVSQFCGQIRLTSIWNQQNWYWHAQTASTYFEKLVVIMCFHKYLYCNIS